MAGHWTREACPEAWGDRPPTERDLIRYSDPAEDLSRRASKWGHKLAGEDLAGLALFAAGLAEAEGLSWVSGGGDLALRAYEARRFLLSDRIIHWAVPWLEAVRRRHQACSEAAASDRGFLLRLGDEMRVAPLLPGREGLRPEGEDSYGPTAMTDDGAWLESLWSGVVLLDTEDRPDPETYDAAADGWVALATAHPGSAEIWSDLAARARSTARWLRTT